MYETTTKEDRNKFVIAHIIAGKSLKEVQQLLLDAGYSKIDITRVWKIWKKSSDYVAKRAKERHCTFCLENRAIITMITLIKNSRVIGKICEDCWAKRPAPPVKESE